MSLTGGFARGPAADPVSYPSARWWSRIAASAVDAVLVGMATYALILVIYVLHGYPTTHVNGRAQTVLTLRELWPYGLIWLLYSAGFLCRAKIRNGETLGKAGVHIRVIRRDGKPVDLPTALLREGVGKVLPLVCATITPVLSALATLYIAVDCLWPL